MFRYIFVFFAELPQPAKILPVQNALIYIIKE